MPAVGLDSGTLCTNQACHHYILRPGSKITSVMCTDLLQQMSKAFSVAAFLVCVYARFSTGMEIIAKCLM